MGVFQLFHVLEVKFKIQNMKRMISIPLFALAITLQAQNRENDTLEEKLVVPFELNQEAINDMQRSFRQSSYDIPLFSTFQQEPIFETSMYKNNFHPIFLFSNTKESLPLYERIQTHFFQFQVKTSYDNSPYVMQKKMFLSFSLTDKISFYINGELDWIRQSPVYLPADIQPMSFGTGVSFKLKDQKSLDVGVKCQYTRGTKYSDIYKKWDSLMDCTLHF